MSWTRAALGLIVAVAVALVLVSGGSDADPRTPAALAGEPPPFLGTALAGDGGATAAVDAYGDVVDLRRSPAGAALIDNPSARQAAGTVPDDTGIVPRVSVDGGPALAPWRADSVSQHYLPGTNVVRTVARFGRVRTVMTVAATAASLAETVAVAVAAPSGTVATPSLGVNLIAAAGDCVENGEGSKVSLVCELGAHPAQLEASLPAAATEGPSPAVTIIAATIARAAAARDRAWLARAQPLGRAAPAWARRLYERSLLTLRALTDPESGALAAGARDGWAYVWPRDAATAALALAASGYRREARRVARFLTGLDLSAAARFSGDGTPVPGRGPQGDAAGWVAVAAEATGLPRTAGVDATGFPQPAGVRGTASTSDSSGGESSEPSAEPWRHRPDYQEGPAGDYLGNAIASAAVAGSASATSIGRGFGTPQGLVRRAGDPGSGLDSAAAWAVRPFPQPALFPAVRRTLLRLTSGQTRFGITPGTGWTGGVDPWSAPTAWSAWALAALANSERDQGAGGTGSSTKAAREDRRQALRLLGDLRRAATPAGALPERVDATTGVPRSTTPLAWPHAFAILALRQLWPSSS